MTLLFVASTERDAVGVGRVSRRAYGTGVHVLAFSRSFSTVFLLADFIFNDIVNISVE